ncbi:MAG: thioredoxin family protein [Candidatus Hermodarchaeota archaeon]
MVSEKEVKWSDLVSSTMTPDDYLKSYNDKIAYNYETYKLKIDVIKKIEDLLIIKDESLKILAFGADWCPDCSKNIPRMIKIIMYMNKINVEFKILYGIMTNPFHKAGDTIWHKTRSPPEAIDPKFNLKKIPTFYFFNKNGDCLGTIIENPKYKSTLEEDLFEIIQKNL